MRGPRHHRAIVYKMPSLCKHSTFSTCNRDNVALLVVVDVLSAQSHSIGESKHLSKPVGTQSGDRSSAAHTVHGKKPSASFAWPDSVTATHADNDHPNGGDVAKSPLLGNGDDSCPCSRPPKTGRLVIANTHLLFNPKRGDIKAAQLMVLTESVER